MVGSLYEFSVNIYSFRNSKSVAKCGVFILNFNISIDKEKEGRKQGFISGMRTYGTIEENWFLYNDDGFKADDLYLGDLLCNLFEYMQTFWQFILIYMDL